MKTLYFDCFSGISGDMTIGALLDLGVDFSVLESALQSLHLNGWSIKKETAIKNGICGTAFHVLLEEAEAHDSHGHTHEVSEGHHHHGHVHRTYGEIAAMIDHSDLSQGVKALSKSIFETVAKAEGKIHGKPMEEVHFHEVGALDSIVDIVGTAICLEQLSPDRIVCSALPMTRGFVHCQHGVFPLPAPAAAEILRDVPVYFSDAGIELVTPTGAAIVKTVADAYGDSLSGAVQAIGYGIGKATYEVPNVLRVMLVEEDEKKKSGF